MPQLQHKHAVVYLYERRGVVPFPEKFPQVSREELEALLEMSYAERAAKIIGKYLDEFDASELLAACEGAYSRFESYGGLAVVEIALYGNYVDVISVLRGHLQLLHFGYAFRRIKNADFYAVSVLAAYYAKRMGLPVRRLHCASNENKIIADFLSTGVYDMNREFYKTTSPSMDILLSSNLERLVFEVSGRNAKLFNLFG